MRLHGLVPFAGSILLAAAPAAGDGFLLFQHGGRTTAQAGAFAARASDPSAVRFNPAAIARLDGLQFQAGLDFLAPTDEFEGGGRTDSPDHLIQFPPALYLSWKPAHSSLPLAFGVSLDAPVWTIRNWNTALFPGRFDTLRQELTLYEIRPTVAWAIDERWSVGAALRYVDGDLESSFAHLRTFGASPAPRETVEITTEVATNVDGLGFDLALSYAGGDWGFGVVASSGVALDGGGEATHELRDPPILAQTATLFAAEFPGTGARGEFELPPTLTVGFFWTPIAALAVEIDLAWAGWSALDRTTFGLADDPFGASPPPALDRRRDWDDTLALRVGAERSFDSGWAIGAGLSWEPSPVPDATREPGFPRGDAYVVSLGGSYNLPGLSFDLGYSRHLHEDRDGTLSSAIPTAGFVPVTGTYSASSQVFSVSARWRK